ncbi:MAG: hypothetical protein ACU0DB_13765, partial [Paracoccus sp. (in: a-proteobacteria)]
MAGWTQCCATRPGPARTRPPCRRPKPPADSMIFEAARAKLNLALHVTGRREDGYHLLDSLVAFADIGDR